MVGIVTFSRENSKRLPGKNSYNINGKMLIEYTLNIMQKLRHDINYVNCFCFSDNEEILKKCNDYDVCGVKEPKELTEISNIKLNKWADMLIQLDNYVLLQPTNPIRDYELIKKWIDFCFYGNIQSAFSVYKKDNKFIENGNFYYYTKDFMYYNNHVKSNDSILLQDKYFCDIDYKEDLEKCEDFLKNKK
jgi:CMP-N-acetylneuraminic acid synthetase